VNLIRTILGFVKDLIPTTLKSFTITALVLILVLPLIIGKATDLYEKSNWDDDKTRGAIIGVEDAFGDKFEHVFPDDNEWPGSQDWQNWSPSDSMWFYTTTQGSDVIPYDFFMVLEQEDSADLFRDNEHIAYYRYIPLKATSSNPDALPLGFVKDTYKGREYIGFTCAACHTTQINYQGVGMRIDGGPAMSDMYSFMTVMDRALTQTWENEAKRERFVKAVLARNDFGKIFKGGRDFTSSEEVLEALFTFKTRIKNYVVINRSAPGYGYARLDAFGRIFNRTLEHLLNTEAIESVLADTLEPNELKEVLKHIDESIVSNQDFDHLFEKLQPLLSTKQMLQFRDALFNKPDAPVSYPFLWDIPQHDYVQWNGIAANAGVGPIGRNSGEVIGVFGTLDWQEESGFSLSAFIGGQGIGKHISYQSSINVRNLRHIENRLVSLQSPQWPEDILGKIDHEKAQRGRKLFLDHCAGCHQDIDRSAEDRRVIAQMLKTKAAGTDPTMANNSVRHVGKSGILKNQYQGFEIGKILIQDTSPVAVLLTAATTNVVATPDFDKGYIRRWSEWIYHLVAAFFSNEIKASIKQGNYNPDTTAAPFNSLVAYKARPLNGIWATAPYLHNGSVPTLYDLLLRKKRQGNPEDGEYRPDEFRVGSREFDPVKVGFVTAGFGSEDLSQRDGTRFLTELRGNSNAGHEYGRLSVKMRHDLVEYMKTL
jgi:hypothetical protein